MSQAPPHLESKLMRRLDVYGCILLPMLEFYVSYALFGNAGLWVTFTS